MKLIEYCFNKPEEVVLYNNYHFVNRQIAQNRLKLLKELPQDPTMKSYTDRYEECLNYDSLKKVTFGSENSTVKFHVSGKEFVKKVVLLTDKYCGSSGEQFIIIAQKSPLAITMGRNTLGCIDFSNCYYEKLLHDGGQYTLQIPTSVCAGIQDNVFLDGVGIQVVAQIEWSPVFFTEDMDIKNAVDEIRKN